MVSAVELKREKIYTLCQDVAVFFGIGEVLSLKPVDKGGNHLSFFLTSTKGRYILRIMNHFSSSTLENEVAVQKQLRLSDVVCNRFIFTATGECLFFKDGLSVTLSKYIEGSQPKPTYDDCIRIGSALAKFHNTVKSVPHPTSHTLITQEKIDARAAKMRKAQRQVVNHLTSGFLNVNKSNLPLGVCHGDLHLANILIDDKKVALLDLENVNYGFLVLDVARSIADVCSTSGGLNVEKVKFYIQGYVAIRLIKPAEKEILKSAISYSAAAIAAWFYERGDIGMYEYFINIGLSSDAMDFKLI
jgi:Ser/Thr protein kinase RdoA (MazF antagonist)